MQKKHTFPPFILILFSALLLAACSGGAAPDDDHDTGTSQDVSPVTFMENVL
jgi:PBP1b-binding outer membrane lipoprotein LpoB